MRRRIVMGAMGAGAAILLVVAAVVGLRALFCSHRTPDDETLRELAAIAGALRGKEFDIARVEDGALATFAARARGSLVEYDPKERMPLQSIIGRGVPHRRVYLIERRASTIRFTLGGAVDDQWGVLYAPGGDIALEDVANLSKIAGHPEWYEFDTQTRSR